MPLFTATACFAPTYCRERPLERGDARALRELPRFERLDHGALLVFFDERVGELDHGLIRHGELASETVGRRSTLRSLRRNSLAELADMVRAAAELAVLLARPRT